MIDATRALGLKGMAGAFDEAVTTGLQRKRTIHEVLTDLLRAEAAHCHAASIRYRMTAARLPVIKDLDTFVFEATPINEGLVRSLHAGSFLPRRCNIVLIGGTGTGKAHLATGITIIDLIQLDKERDGHIVAHQLEMLIVKQVADIGPCTGEEIIDAKHIRAGFQKGLTQVPADKTGAAGEEDTVYMRACSKA